MAAQKLISFNGLENSIIVLGTSPGTRAERFYVFQGWKNIGSYSDGEIEFELSYHDLINKVN